MGRLDELSPKEMKNVIFMISMMMKLLTVNIAAIIFALVSLEANAPRYKKTCLMKVGLKKKHTTKWLNIGSLAFHRA